jgi:site-specific recombinase XerD
MSWLDDKAVKFWFGQLGNKQTIRNYTSDFPNYLEFVIKTTQYKTPNQIITARLEQKQLKDLNQQRFFEDLGKRFVHELNKTGKAYNTKKSYLRTMLSFFSINHSKLEYSRGELFNILEHTQQDKEQKWVPTNEEIRLLYRMASHARDRAIILMLYQSGMSEIDLCNMKIELLHLYDDRGNWQIPISEDLYFASFREKTNIAFQTCISREALEEIRIYLQNRGFPKEGSLFVSMKQQITLDVREIHDILKQLVTKAFNGKAELWKTKNLRDSFMNALEKAKVPTEIKDVFVGHSRTGAKKSYTVTEDTIKTLYAESFKYLTINGFGSTSRKVEELETKFTEQLKAMTETLTALRNENAQLKTQLGTVADQQNTIQKTLANITELPTVKRELQKQRVKVDIT